MLETSDDALRMKVRYPTLFRVFAIGFTVLGVLITPIVIAEAFGASHGLDPRGLTSGLMSLLFGALYLRRWRDTELVLDRRARTIAYDSRPKISKAQSVRATFADAARIEVRGTINWTGIYLVLKDGRQLYLEALPRTRKGQAEMRTVLTSIGGALGVEVVVPDFIRKWWTEI